MISSPLFHESSALVSGRYIKKGVKFQLVVDEQGESYGKEAESQFLIQYYLWWTSKTFSMERTTYRLCVIEFHSFGLHPIIKSSNK